MTTTTVTMSISFRKRRKTPNMSAQYLHNVLIYVLTYWLMHVNCCLTDGIDVLYNKFNVDSLSPPDSPPQHPNSDHNCVVATTGQWRVSHCDQRHGVVCQSDTLIGKPVMTIQKEPTFPRQKVSAYLHALLRNPPRKLSNSVTLRSR